jgi:hypothetical protein
MRMLIAVLAFGIFGWWGAPVFVGQTVAQFQMTPSYRFPLQAGGTKSHWVQFPSRSGATFACARFPSRSGATFACARFPSRSGATFARARFPSRSGGNLKEGGDY